LKGDLGRLIATHHRDGLVDWIGIRPWRLADVVELAEVDVLVSGLSGDHGRAGKRALTLIQTEHLAVIAALAGARARMDPALLRRNLVISGINLTALQGANIRIGTALIRLTGACAPCSRMEVALGRGG
jgi:MOSC domain-containing protein YiiM